MILNDKLASLNLPDIMKFSDGTPVTADRWEKRRLQLLEMLRNEEYGHAPEGPFEVTSSVVEEKKGEYAGKCDYKRIKLDIKCDEGEYSFEFVQYIPKSEKKLPAIVFINFRPGCPDRYYPIEEIVDRGVATFMIDYSNVTRDRNDDFSTGVAAVFDRAKYDWGKIYMWAWACSRVCDYVETLGDIIDLENLAVMGHSRLGKTALWCAANDTRFKYAFVNCSGCSGDAITRQKTGEHVKEICRAVGYWFNEEYKKYIDNEENMPFDQHWLVAAVAPRYIVSGTAVEDDWADPYSQFLSGYAASEAWKLCGKTGVVCPDRLPKEGEVWLEGDVGFYMRSGAHFLSRYDWNRYIDFMQAKMNENK